MDYIQRIKNIFTKYLEDIMDTNYEESADMLKNKDGFERLESDLQSVVSGDVYSDAGSSTGVISELCDGRKRCLPNFDSDLRFYIDPKPYKDVFSQETQTFNLRSLLDYIHLGKNPKLFDKACESYTNTLYTTNLSRPLEDDYRPDNPTYGINCNDTLEIIASLPPQIHKGKTDKNYYDQNACQPWRTRCCIPWGLLIVILKIIPSLSSILYSFGVILGLFYLGTFYLLYNFHMLYISNPTSFKLIEGQRFAVAAYVLMFCNFYLMGRCSLFMPVIHSLTLIALSYLMFEILYVSALYQLCQKAVNTVLCVHDAAEQILGDSRFAKWIIEWLVDFKSYNWFNYCYSMQQ